MARAPRSLKTSNGIAAPPDAGVWQLSYSNAPRPFILCGVAEPIPADSFLHRIEVFGVRARRRIWRDGTGRNARYYTWDGLHGEVEVFNGREKHLGAVDAVSGVFIKEPVEGRTLGL